MKRTQVLMMKTIGLGLAGLSYVAPTLAARIATFLWFTPFPFARTRPQEIPPGARKTSYETAGSVVHGYEIGDGPRTALLVHGWAGSSRQYRRIASRLADDGYRSVVIDLPAHGVEAGRSTDVPEIAEAIERAGNAIGRLDLIVAHSLGAMSTSLALAGPLTADRLVLLAPVLRPLEVVNSFAASLRLRPRVAKAVEQSMETRFGADMWDRIPNTMLELQIPDRTLVIHDLDDDTMPIDGSRELSRRWGLDLVTTRGHGHNGVLRAPEVIDQIRQLAVAEAVAD